MPYSKFRHAILSYIAIFMTTSSQTHDLRLIFMELDQDKDGKITVAELKEAFRNLKLADMIDTERIFGKCSLN